VQLEMNGCNNFFFTGLEESIFDVRKGYINYLVFSVAISKAIEMAFQVSFHLFLSNAWTGI